MLRVITGCVAILAGCSKSLATDLDSDYYRGKTINLVLGMGEGGGFDIYAKVFSSYLTKHLPGHPRIVIQHMPGAAGIRAMQYLATAAPRDGTAISLQFSSLAFAALTGAGGTGYDARRMTWLGALNHQASICSAWASSGITSWDDLRRKPFIVGSNGAGSQTDSNANLLNRLFGTQLRVINGYQSVHEIYLAMERGEVQGHCSAPLASVLLTRPTWFETGKVKVPVQFSKTRDRRMPETPTIFELAPDETARQIVALTLAPQSMGRPFVAPPDLPPALALTLRTAFEAAVRDPEFLAEAQRENLEIDGTNGVEVTSLIERAYATPPEIVQRAKDVLR